jgi:hypothetical protein
MVFPDELSLGCSLKRKTLKEEGGSKDDFSLQLGPTSLAIREVA